MIQSYETMYILRPDLGEERVSEQVSTYRDMLAEQGGSVEIQVMGKKRMAYPIERFQDGIYVLMNYSVTGAAIAPMERAMRLSEEVLRFLTIKIEASPAAAAEPEPVES